MAKKKSQRSEKRVSFFLKVKVRKVESYKAYNFLEKKDQI